MTAQKKETDCIIQDTSLNPAGGVKSRVSKILRSYTRYHSINIKKNVLIQDLIVTSQPYSFTLFIFQALVLFSSVFKIHTVEIPSKPHVALFFLIHKMKRKLENPVESQNLDKTNENVPRPKLKLKTRILHRLWH